MVSVRSLLVDHQFLIYLIVQLDILFGHFLGLACRPADMVYCPCLLVASVEGLQSWLGGLGSLVFVFLVRFVCFALVDGQLLCQCDLLFTRLGLMPCSAWSKKKSPGKNRIFLPGHLNASRTKIHINGKALRAHGEIFFFNSFLDKY